MRKKITFSLLFTMLTLCTVTHAENCTGFYNRSNHAVMYTQLPDGPASMTIIPEGNYINNLISVDYEDIEKIYIPGHGAVNADPLPVNHSLIYYGYNHNPVWEIKKGCNG